MEVRVKPVRILVALVAIVVPALVGWMLQSAPAAKVQRAAPVLVKNQPTDAPRVVGVPINKAHALHTQLMADANALKVSNVLPPPTPHSAGMEARAAEQQAPSDDLKEVPDGRKIAIYFTANVIGETDPCG